MNEKYENAHNVIDPKKYVPFKNNKIKVHKGEKRNSPRDSIRKRNVILKINPKYEI